MKNIFVINHWSGIAGGNVSLVQISSAINKMSEKYFLTVYCPESPTDLANWLEEEGIEVIKSKSFPATFNHYQGSNKFILSYTSLKYIYKVIMKEGWKEIEESLRSKKPDLVILNSMTLFWMGPLIRKMGYKTICFQRETFINGFFSLRTLIMKKMMKKYFDGIVFISNNDLNEMGQDYNKELNVITDKVDLSKYKRTITKNINTSNKTIKILYLGGMSRLKGAFVIVKALEILRKELDFKLIFLKYDLLKQNNYKPIGRRIKNKIFKLVGIKYEFKVLKFIEKHDLYKNIEFFDTVRNPEELIMNSDVVVFPSSKPHQARPLYEAGAAMTPCIISDFKETSEFAMNEFNCLTFKAGNANDLAKKLLRVIKDQEIRRKIVVNNYNQTVKNHDFNSLSEELDRLFCSITEH